MTKINEFIEGAASDTKFLASLASNHEARLLGSIQTLRENIIGMVNKLDSSSAGKLEGVKVNLKQAQKIHKQMVGQFEKDYNKKVNKMLGDFSQVDKVITRRYKALNESIEFTGIDKVMTDSLKLSTYGRYVQFGEQARNSIASAMYNSVAGGAKMSTLVNTIKGILTGHKDAKGRPMTMYAKGFAQDAVMNYHNQVNTKKGEDAGMTHFLYYGDIIGTSRQFCITRVGKVYNKRQILAWDSLSWQGKAGPAFSDRGGYNCRHHWRPVRKEWLQNEDKEQISRNEILGEMAVPNNVKARNLSSKIDTKMGLLEKLEDKEALLKEKMLATPAAKKESFEALLLNTQEKVALKKEIKNLRERLAKLGGTVKPKLPPVVKPKIKPPVAKAPPVVKPKPLPPGTVPKLDKETKAFVGKVKYYVKGGKKVGQNSKMFKYWESMEDSNKQYFLDLWESQGIDITAYKHLFPAGKVPLPVPKPKVPKPKKPPVVVKPPVVKPKVPKIGGGTAKLIEDTYIEIDNQIAYLEELIELTPGAKTQGFEELVAHLQQRLLVVDDINRLNQKLLAMGAKPRVLPKGIEKIQKKIIEKAKEVKIIDFPVEKTYEQRKVALLEKLEKQGIIRIADGSYDYDKFTIEHWVDNILQPLSDDLDKMFELNPHLADAMNTAPVKGLDFLRGWNLEKVGHSNADGVYYSGWRQEIAVASRASGSMLEPDHALQIGKRRILKDGSDMLVDGAAWNVSSESGTAASVWRHELGHHVHISQLNYNPIWDDLRLNQSWDDIWNQKGPSWFRKNVTEYAATNAKEAFAETFAGYYSPLYKRGLLPNILEEFMDALSTGIYKGYNAVTFANTVESGASIMAKKMSASEVEKIFKKVEKRPVNILASKTKPLTKSKLTKDNSYTRNKKGKWFLKGKPVSAAIEKKIKKIAVPPAWTDVLVSTDFKAETLAVGRDAVNKLQYRFSKKHVTTSAKKKYVRTKNFKKDMPGIRRKIEAGIKKGDPRAFVLELENKTAIRIGTDRDMQAKVKAYGLTTLQNEHVVIKGNKIILDFTAKKGTHGHYELVDERLAKFLRARKAQTVKGQKLFPDVTANKLNAYLKELASGKKYTIKDFRTYHATRIALDELEGYAGQILTAKEKKAIVKDVSEIVSRFLSNTPAMAKNSYIDPMVWETIGGL